MNILYVTNVYPTKFRNKSPIVKNMIEQYKKYYSDNIYLLLFDRSNFFKNLFLLRNYIKKNKVEIIHIHFGGLYSFIIVLLSLFTNTKIIITFHGTDIHGKLHKNGHLLAKIKIKINQLASLLTFPFIDKIDFVSENLKKYIPGIYSKIFCKKYNTSILGVDYNTFKFRNKTQIKEKLNLDLNIKYILFINNNNSPVKREYYAKEIIEGLGGGYRILKLENIAYEMIPYYFNVSEFLLLTSESEGSPNVIREALASNLPIVSVDVGDVKSYISKTNSSIIICKYNLEDAIISIKKHLNELEYIKEDTRSKFKEIISYEHTSIKLHELYKIILGI